MYRIHKEHIIYTMSPNNQPCMEVEVGSCVVFETYDCFENQIDSEDVAFQELDWNRINPATGPIYIKCAEPGDILVVTIEKIKIAEQGFLTTGANLGVMGKDLDENTVKIVPIHNEYVLFSNELQIPIHPMIGVIGTAPKEESISCGTPHDHGGNMDCKEIKEGTTLLLPVNVSGALLALGDLHAAMGDGEIGVSGVEVAGEVTVTVQIIKGKKWPLPMAIQKEKVMTIASEKLLDDAANRAVRNMVTFLHEELEMSKANATLLLSAAGDLRVCQVVDPLKTARMELRMDYVEKLGFDFSKFHIK
ncbi:acetamidase/formamidase family protein [Bacillus albus]|uniref:acetamidase/formamidase family protein n=1 Tax=Bacillus cereus group TaxID=86661 RepID=UPI0022E93C73|nr:MULTISPECIES: acetamidase/formamidase family protein [Bacillus cereus group]MDA2025955.1 acetamidase/formamidase family protein [Bacillus cereus group sp. Bcc03]MDA2215733.1 acetamidase/formamidase family protein [Bacillus cereus group sp. Bc228]MDA2225891.1 acetamidase/formamidase family protein [Bacillus cereus group sp. Bc227]MDA2260059.1 acetamidase/formamidase family protein [Bacillus cereus group sp. Bc200]MDA2320227.1 acetamidase/formamidase family protein [Bacillus cereus group sp. 